MHFDMSRFSNLISGKHTIAAAILISALGFAGASYASGADHGGSHPSSSSGTDAELYTLGKKVYKEHINCASCLVNKNDLSREEAKTLHAEIKRDKNLKNSLSNQERRALSYYMRKRFGY